MNSDPDNTLDRKHVLIVGGDGRVGRALRRRFSRGMATATILVRQPSKALTGETIVQVSDYYSPPRAVFDQVDTVINCTGVVGRGGNKDLLWPINVEGPVRLARLARESGVRGFFQMSSLAVYGNARLIGQTSDELPITLYGHSKKAADHGLMNFHCPEFCVTLFRIPMLYGPNGNSKLWRLARLMNTLGWFPVQRPIALRSVLHFENLATYVTDALFRRLGGVQFAADPQAFTIALLADAFWQYRQRRVKIVEVPAAALLPLRLVANNIYTSLFEQSLIGLTQCIELKKGSLISTNEGLLDVLPD